MDPISRIAGISFRSKLVGSALALSLAVGATVLIHPWSRLGPRPVVIAAGPTQSPSPEAPNADGSPSESPSPSPSKTAEREEAKQDTYVRPDVHYDNPSLSRDAGVVTFTIRDADYPAQHVKDVYVRSRSTHRTSLVSRAWDGGRANGDSDNAVVSSDGTRIAFVSEASNLVAGDTNGARDVFVRDLVEHTTRRVSVSSNGTQGNGPSGTGPVSGWQPTWGVPAISADGRYVAFESEASNLAPNDANGKADVFVHDLETGDTVAVSLTEAGATGDGASHHPSISADGDTVAFHSFAKNLTADARPQGTTSGVFIRDLERESTELASVSPDGGWLPEWNGWATLIASGDVVYFINVPNLPDEDPEFKDDEGGDIVRRDLAAKKTSPINPPHNTYHMKRVALSANGSVMAYINQLGGMDPFCYQVPAEPRGGYLGACRSVSVSQNGRYIAFDAGWDALSDPDDEKRFGGDYGAMIYDRVTDEFVAAWKW